LYWLIFFSIIIVCQAWIPCGMLWSSWMICCKLLTLETMRYVQWAFYLSETIEENIWDVALLVFSGYKRWSDSWSCRPVSVEPEKVDADASYNWVSYSLDVYFAENMFLI
jgi:hypothetical protein